MVISTKNLLTIVENKEFINNLNHKVKTPLTAIINGIQLLNNYEHNEHVRRIMDYLILSAVDLTKTIMDIIELYDIIKGKPIFKHDDINLLECINFINNSHNLQFIDEHINFKYNIPTDCIINSDREKVIQILHNLIDNSIKAFASIQINKKIMLDVNILDNNRIQFIVQDNGFNKLIFNPNNITPDNIWIIITKYIIENMGPGSYINISRPTCTEYSNAVEIIFNYTLPQIIQPISIIKPTDNTNATSSCDIADIAIIDDNTVNLHLLDLTINNILKTSKYKKINIKSFADSVAGLNYLTSVGHTCKLVLLDVKMQHITGFDIINMVSKHYHGTLPFHIVVLSALTKQYITETITHIIKSNPNINGNIHIGHKPYVFSELVHYIDLYCKNTRKYSSIV